MTNGVNERFSVLLEQSSVVPRKKYKKYSTGTYIGLIAYAILDSPDKMLTFKQIMKKLEPFVFGEKKGIENNIRVCLSSNRCFAKVPVDPDYPNPKKNFWKVDESGITAKMFRRHFKYIMNLFPGLSIQAHQVDECEENSYAPEPLTPVCTVAENKSEVKFTGPFSIESLLKSDREVKRMHSTRLEEQRLYIDPQRGATKRKNFYEYNTVECYYPVSAVGSQLVSAKRPRVSSGPSFGLSLPPQITYDQPVLLRSPFMYDARYVRW
ncbi:forkhead box protein H1-like [Megalobrama amblycephala]|uniref:forkhead box protein H1-like n=1 Tax=Megalobrama amblycephala TaxID=75352 RepID=UPI0020146978|nr:forkhead box protein H1-like [Megalobrama amblycephala]